MSQLHTRDQLTAPRGRDTERGQSHDSEKTKQNSQKQHIKHEELECLFKVDEDLSKVLIFRMRKITFRTSLNQNTFIFFL